MTDTKAPRVKRKLPLDPESESWHKLPWRKFEQHVYRIQKRIFRAEQRGNQRAVQKLQKLLTKSKAELRVDVSLQKRAGLREAADPAAGGQAWQRDLFAALG